MMHSEAQALTLAVQKLVQTNLKQAEQGARFRPGILALASFVGGAALLALMLTVLSHFGG